MIPIHDGSGDAGNTVQINFLEGNVFNPQLGLLQGNVSNDSTYGGVTENRGNPAGTGPSVQGTSLGHGNTVQINILSFNIYNPQWSVAGNNVSNNSTVSNVATNNGNDVSNTTMPGGLLGAMLLGGLSGNGNTTQLAFFSGNIINPQFTLGGTNVSNNTAVTNVAANNGNGSTQVLSAGFLMPALFGGAKGNGNTTQVAVATSNIVNPQYSFGAGNSSNNSATTNDANDNGNFAHTVTPAGPFGTVAAVGGMSGNGNTTQVANSSGNILNNQVNVGIAKAVPTIAASVVAAAGPSSSPAPRIRPAVSATSAGDTPGRIRTSGARGTSGPGASASNEPSGTSAAGASGASGASGPSSSKGDG